MPLINQVKEMQQQGFSDEQVSQKLSEQGFQPLEISQALEQAKIKSAIYQNAQNPEETAMAAMTTGMQPSVMAQEQPSQQQPAPQQPLQEEQYIYPKPQPYYQEYPQYQSTSPDTMTEIAEQIATEKISALKKELGNIQDFKTTLTRKIEYVDERLKKIENIIEKLQESIISKIGSYGESVESIKDEMSMMQESFSQALNPLIDKSREKTTKHEAENTAEEKEEKQPERKKKKSAIEHYLRR